MTDSHPPDGVGFSARADRRLIRARGRSPRYVRVEIRAPEAPPGDRRLPVSLAFVLDRSGSMAGSKIEKARRAVIQGIRSLSSEDRFSVVVYDNIIEVIVPSTSATPENRRAAERAVRAIEVGGSTDLCEGWLRGCEQAGHELGEDTVGRCLLLTDGIANEGITDHHEIVRHARALRDRRVSTSTFGVGADFDETLLRPMADAGGGNFHFIEVAQQIPEFIAQEVGEALQLTARDVALIVEPGTRVAVDSLNGFPCRRIEVGVWRVEIGSLFSGRIIDPALRLTFPPGAAGDRRHVAIRVDDRDGVFEGAVSRLQFEWANDAAVDTQERDLVVQRRVVELTAARAYQGALERNRAGDYAGARELLEVTSERINRFAGEDPQTMGTLGTLRLQAGQVEQAMDSMARKREYTGTCGTLTGREVLPTSMPIPTRNVALMPVGDVRTVVDAVVPHLAAADPELFGDMILDGRLSQALDGQKVSAPLDQLEVDRLVGAASQWVPDARMRVVFTTRPLADNGSSCWDNYCQTAVVSLAQLEGRLAAAPHALVAAEIVFHALHLLDSGQTPHDMGHHETRGCLYDVQRTHASVERALEGEGLCPECLHQLAARRLPPDRLLRLHAAVKELAVRPEVVH